MLDHASISGQAVPGTYSQTYTFSNFCIVFCLSGSEEEVNLDLGRNNISKIEEIVGQTPTITTEELTQMQKGQFVDGIKLSLLVAKIEGQKMSLSGFGEVGAKLVRKGKIINLLPARGEGLAASDIKSVSGPLLHGDLIILGTSTFFSKVVINDLANAAEKSLEEIKENLLPTVETTDQNSQMAVSLIKIDLRQKPEEVAEEESVPSQKMEKKEEEPAAYPEGGVPEGSSPFRAFKKLMEPGRRKLLFRREVREEFINGQYRRYFYLALVVLVTLVALVAYQLRSRSLEVSTQNLQSVEKKADDDIAQAAKLEGLNDQIARQMLGQSRQEVLSEIQKDFGPDWQKSKGAQGQKLRQIVAKIDGEINKTSHIYEVGSLEPFYDFSLLKSGPKIVSANVHNSQIIALDPDNGAVYSLSTKNKAGAIVTGATELKNGRFVDFSGDSVYVFGSDGIRQKSLGKDLGNKLVIKPSDKWGEIKKMGIYGGNIYLLDRRNNQIWKYQGTASGFADINSYLNSDLKEDFSGSVDLAIDGFVYVLLKDGTILRFGGGGPTDFALSGLVDSIKSAEGIFTSEENKNIYLLDLKGKKIVVVDKKGVYQAEYDFQMASGQGLGAAVLLADESVKKIFLISGAVVYGIDIKQ